MDGNEAVAYGAMFAGCNFFAGYPITPSSEIMVFLIEQMPKFDRTVLQVEDEISAINMLVGASYAGMKAMTATSGPGISLMNEAIGLAAMAELPCVLVNVQRGGPSTGAPTKMEQADLQQALYGTHGDAPVAVLAPTDIPDCFGITVTAFNIAEKYQTPVIVLSDQFIGQRKECLKSFDLSQFTTVQRITPSAEDLKEPGKYHRFENSENGVSKITHPGMKNGQYLACGLTHNESGSPTSRHVVHERLNQKRYRKFDYLRQEYEHLIERYGAENAEIGILTWGSARGAVQEAIEQANSQGIKISGMVPKLLYPLPVDTLQAYVRSLHHLLVVELSYSAQFYQYLRTELDLPAQTVVYKRSGCMPFMVEEIFQHIQQFQR
jgi:2-oxoglutarate ferredoxin oxidoreductase subunit alpha